MPFYFCLKKETMTQARENINELMHKLMFNKELNNTLDNDNNKNKKGMKI